MSMASLETYRRRYALAGRGWKTRILDEVCAMEGWTRKHAIKVLRRKVRRQAEPPRGRKPTYGPEVAGMLEEIWLLMDQPCGKLMAPGLPQWIDSYERRHGALPIKMRNQLLEVSAAQIDRLLSAAKLRHPRKRRAGGGSVHLRNQIPVRVGPWAPDTPPGFLEMDTVSHGGDSTRGTYLWTLTATDISSGWTMLAPAWGCGQHSVLEAFRAMGARLPFRLRGIDTDNGHEFINHHLLAHVRRLSEPIEFTRSRARKKNDNAHVEQKNATHVREQVGKDAFFKEVRKRGAGARHDRLRRARHGPFSPPVPDTRPPRQPAFA